MLLIGRRLILRVRKEEEEGRKCSPIRSCQGKVTFRLTFTTASQAKGQPGSSLAGITVGRGALGGCVGGGGWPEERQQVNKLCLLLVQVSLLSCELNTQCSSHQWNYFVSEMKIDYRDNTADR